MNAPEAVAVPPGVVTVTSFTPTAPAGAVHVIRVAVIDTFVASVPPTATEVVPRKFAPLIVSAVPPDASPPDGVTDAIDGAA